MSLTYSEVKELFSNNDIDEVKEVIRGGLLEPVLIEQYIKDSFYPLEVYLAAQELGIEDVEDCYQGEWDSDEELVQGLLDDTGCIPKDLPSYVYIDWERTAGDIMVDFCSHNNHYFRNC